MNNSSPRFSSTGQPVSELLTRAEASKMLRISQRKLAEMKASGQIAFVQIGRSVRFDIRDIQNWIDEHRYVGHRRVKKSGHAQKGLQKASRT